MAPEQTAKYRCLFFQKSDGKLEIVTKKKKKETNAPTTSQMDSTPDSKGVADYYRLIPIGDEKEVEWRRKLGGMMKREIGEPENESKTCPSYLADLFKA